jgi:hypothetical protein
MYPTYPTPTRALTRLPPSTHTHTHMHVSIYVCTCRIRKSTLRRRGPPHRGVSGSMLFKGSLLVRRCQRGQTHLLRIPHTQACRYELRGDVCDYCHAAARHLAPGGVFALVFPISPPFQMQRVWTGAQEAGLKMIRHRPVVFKEGEAPILGLFLMCLKEHVPDDFREWTEPPLIIRKRTGSSAPSVPYEGGPRGRGWVCFAGWRAPLLAHST